MKTGYDDDDGDVDGDGEDVGDFHSVISFESRGRTRRKDDTQETSNEVTAQGSVLRRNRSLLTCKAWSRRAC